MNNKPNNINKFLNVLRSPLKILGLVSIVLLLAGIVTAWTYTNPPRVDCFDNGTCVNGNTKWNETTFIAESFYATSNVTAGYYNTTDGRELQNGGCDASYCIRYNLTDGTTVEAINGTDGSKISGADAATVSNLALATAGAPPKKKFVFIGNFTLSTELLPQNYSILDTTQANITLGNGVATGTGDAMVSMNTPIHDVDIIGGTWNGNSAGQSSWHILIQMWGSNLTLSEAAINDSRGDCVFSRNHGNRVSKNRVSYCQDTGIVLGGLKTSTSSMYSIASENIISNSVSGLNTANDADYVTFDKNTVMNSTGNGITVTQTVNGNRKPNHVKITNNDVLFSPVNNAAGTGCGINIGVNYSKDILIEGNSVNKSGKHGICVYGGTAKIRGNTVSNSGQYGIVLSGNDTEVYENTVYNNSENTSTTDYGIWVNSDNNTVIGNMVYDEPHGAIIISSGKNDNIVVDNWLNKSTTPITNSGTRTILRDNHGAAPFNWGLYAGTGTNISAFGAGDTFFNSTKGAWCLATAAGTANWVRIDDIATTC